MNRTAAAIAFAPLCLLLAEPRAQHAEPAPVPGVEPPRPLPNLPRVPCYLLTEQDRRLTAQWLHITIQTTPLAELLAAEEPGKQAPATGSLLVGDFDGEAGDEFLHRWRQELAVIRGHETRFLPDVARTASGPWFSGRAFDWNGDKAADVLFVDAGTIGLHGKVLGDRTQSTLLDVSGHLLPGSRIEAGTAGDFDRDGRPDLVLALPERGLVWCRNIGPANAPKFSPPVPLWPATPWQRTTGLQLADFDQDGWLDVFVMAGAPGQAGTQAFVERIERTDRTRDEDQQLAEVESELAGLANKERVRIPGLAGPVSGDPFEPLVKKKELKDRRDRLAFREASFVTLPVVVHVRSKTR